MKYDFVPEDCQQGLGLEELTRELENCLQSLYLSQERKIAVRDYMKKYGDDFVMVSDAVGRLKDLIEEVKKSEREKYDNIIDEATVYATGRLRERNDMREIGEKNEK